VLEIARCYAAWSHDSRFVVRIASRNTLWLAESIPPGGMCESFGSMRPPGKL